MKNLFIKIKSPLTILGIAMLFLTVVHLSAQDLSEHNRRLEFLQSRFAIEKSTLDSLQVELNKYITLADNLKASSGADDDQISQAMASALAVGKQHDLQKRNVDSIASLIQKERRYLYKQYSVQIDSLNSLLDESADNNDNERLQDELRELNNLRLQVSPALPLFSFDPALVKKIEIETSGDRIKNSIYRDYLNNALDEVDSNITVIREKSEEVRSMMRLDERAQEFAEDINDGQMLGLLQLQNQDLSRNASPAKEDFTFDNRANISDLRVLYNKLEPVLGERFDVPKFNESDSLLSEEYLELLEDTESTLKLYREIIKDKLVP